MLPGGRSGGSKAWKLVRPCHTRTWFRQHFSRRSGRRSWPLPPHYDPDGDGMCRRWESKRRRQRVKWASFSIAIGTVALWVCMGCKREPQMTPDAVYSSIEKEFISGELPRARERSEEAYRHFEFSPGDSAGR